MSNLLALPKGATSPHCRTAVEGIDVSPIGSLLLLSRRARAYQQEFEDDKLLKQEASPISLMHKVAETSPLGSCLRSMRRVRTYGGTSAYAALVAKSQAILGKDTKMSEQPRKEQDTKMSEQLRKEQASRGLSQTELDAMCAGNEDTDDTGDEREVGMQLQTRRLRAFRGGDAALAFAKEAFERRISSSYSCSQRGLSQAALDALAVHAGDEGDEESSIEAQLLAIRRKRSFQGDMRTDDFDVGLTEEVLPAATRNNLNGLTQAELNSLSVAAPEEETGSLSDVASEASLLHIRRLRAFKGKAEAASFVETRRFKAQDSSGPGLSQDALNDLCINEPTESVDTQNSPSHPEAQLLHVRRMRAFLGSDAANSFAEDALNKAMVSETQTAETSSTCCTPRTSSTRRNSGVGSALLPVSRLCLDVDAKSPSAASPNARIASPSRKRNAGIAACFSSSPVHGGA